jgi:hypothetical protein
LKQQKTNPFSGRACFGAGGNRSDGLTVVVDLVAMGQSGDFLAIGISLSLAGQHDRVGDEVVEEIGGDGAGESQPVELDRRRAQRHDLEPGIHGVALEIDQDIDGVVGDALGGAQRVAGRRARRIAPRRRPIFRR